jgi:mannose-6-phosphate isomerase-like protein (cupin superfamily)
MNSNVQRKETEMMTHEKVEFAGLSAEVLTVEDGFALVEHVLAPRTLGAPMHAHEREDEISYVLEGEIGVQIGDEIVLAGAGELVRKPRGIPHSFWNRADEPARLLEMITPSGFETYFAELAPLLPPAVAEPDFAGMAAVWGRYGLAMDPSTIETISLREGLELPPS